VRKTLLASAVVIGLTSCLVACGSLIPSNPSSHADTSGTTDSRKGWVAMWGGEKTPAGDYMYKRCDGSTLIIKSSASQTDSGIVANSDECR